MVKINVNLPDCYQVDCGYLLNRKETQFACTVEDKATATYISRYYTRATKRDEWVLEETHICRTLADADKYTEGKVKAPFAWDNDPVVQDN